MNDLTRVEFGNPILREVAQTLTMRQISSKKVKLLIKNMIYLLRSKKMGVGLAAPQVGVNMALAVISIHPTSHRPEVEAFDLVIINPEITQQIGYRGQMWEGCISAGTGGLFAKVPRYKKIELKFLDISGRQHKKMYEGLNAQVIQHEVDHLNGVLFVDRVKDPKTYMTMKEYKKMALAKHKSLKML
jgi:peptide deformylase